MQSLRGLAMFSRLNAWLTAVVVACRRRRRRGGGGGARSASWTRSARSARRPRPRRRRRRPPRRRGRRRRRRAISSHCCRCAMVTPPITALRPCLCMVLLQDLLLRRVCLCSVVVSVVSFLPLPLPVTSTDSAVLVLWIGHRRRRWSWRRRLNSSRRVARGPRRAARASGKAVRTNTADPLHLHDKIFLVHGLSWNGLPCYGCAGTAQLLDAILLDSQDTSATADDAPAAATGTHGLISLLPHGPSACTRVPFLCTGHSFDLLGSVCRWREQARQE